MTVTELALLRLIPPVTVLSSDLLTNLRKGKAALEAFDGRPFFFYKCLEDPSLIFIIGSWPSVQVHIDEYIPSSANQECLQAIRDQVDFEWMFHLDADPDKIPLDDPVLAVGRNFIKHGEKSQFMTTFEENEGELESYIGGAEKVAGGWRIDKGLKNTF